MQAHGGGRRDPPRCGRLWWWSRARRPGEHDRPGAHRGNDATDAAPQLLSWWEHGGTVIDSWGYASRHSIALVGASHDPAAPQERHAWLEQFLAWDLGGSPLWRVVDEVALPDTGPADSTCWDAAGRPAVGVHGPEDEPGTVTVAWVVDLAVERFVPADPQGVRCEVVGD